MVFFGAVSWRVGELGYGIRIRNMEYGDRETGKREKE
jgi:hypothetical protein